MKMQLCGWLNCCKSNCNQIGNIFVYGDGDLPILGRICAECRIMGSAMGPGMSLNRRGSASLRPTAGPRRCGDVDVRSDDEEDMWRLDGRDVLWRKG